MPSSLTNEQLQEQLLGAWHIHNAIHQDLLSAIPAKGFDAVPPHSRGRTVREQFAHLQRVRLAWLRYHATGQRPKGLAVKGTRLSRSELKAAFKKSGASIERFLRKCLEGKAKVRMFKGQPVRWLAYLISHESHHRGSILLVLKQNGMRLPESVSLRKVWEPWFWGR